MKVEHEIIGLDNCVEVIEFFRRNHYYLLKFEPDMSKEEFISIQKKRGYLFSAITKIDGTIVAHIAAYMGGSQKIARGSQVFLSQMVIDKKYRTSFFSLTNLYARVIVQLGYLGYRDIICECNQNNLLSLRVIRRFGGVLLDDKTDIYKNYVLHNYILAIHRLIGVGLKIDNDKLSWIPVIAKAHAIEKANIISNKYIEQHIKFDYGNLSVLINVNSAAVCGFDLRNVLKVEPFEKEYQLSFGKHKNDTFEVVFYDGDIESRRIRIEEGVSSMSIRKDEIGTKFTIFDHKRNAQFNIFPEDDIIAHQAQVYQLSTKCGWESDSGKLHLELNGKKKICEMWPCYRYPYNLGYILPEMKTLQAKELGSERIIIEQYEGYEVVRNYIFNDDSTTISTLIFAGVADYIEPLFNFFLEDWNGKVQIHFEDGVVEKTYDFERDNACGNEEVIYKDFQREEYSKKAIDYIDIEYEDIDYRITTSVKTRCFFQYNYLGLVPMDFCKNSKEGFYDLGKIVIQHKTK